MTDVDNIFFGYEFQNLKLFRTKYLCKPYIVRRFERPKFFCEILFRKSVEVSTGSSNYSDEIIHDSLAIQIMNHYDSTVQFGFRKSAIRIHVTHESCTHKS